MMSRIFAIASVVVRELYRRKDFYVLFVLTVIITLILASVSLFNDPRIVRFLKEACLLLIWLSSLVIAITTTARQIPAEKDNRTILPLLAKPVSRVELIVGKFAGCWVACGLSLLVFYLFFAVVTGSREHVWPIGSYGQAIWLHWTMLGIVIAMALWGSIVFAAPSSNSTIIFVLVLGILFIARDLNKVAVQLPNPSGTILYAVYMAVPHLEFFDIRTLVIHDLDLVKWSVVAIATVYGWAYTAAFLILSWLQFRRKSLA